MIKKYKNIIVEKQQTNILCNEVVPVYFNHDKTLQAGYATARYDKGIMYADFVLNIIIANPCNLFPSVGIQKLDDGACILREIGLCKAANLDPEIKPLIIRT